MANLVTLARVLLLFVGVGFIYSRTFQGEMAAFAIILTVILLDGLDGIIARRRNAVTLPPDYQALSAGGDGRRGCPPRQGPSTRRRRVQVRGPW